MAGGSGVPVSSFLLDTSAVIAKDAPASLGDHSAISALTLGELRSGVLLARTAAIRSERARRFVAVHNTFRAIPVDSRVAERYGEVLAFSRRERRLRNIADMLIIATAAEYGHTLYTRDEKQGKLAEDIGLLVEYAS